MAAVGIDRLIVSTDDPEVATLARKAGVDVPFERPPELSTDEATSVAVAEHALEFLRRTDGYVPDDVLLLQPTSPLRKASDIEQAIRIMAGSKPRSVVSVCEAEHHPFWAFGMNPDDTLRWLVEAGRVATRRQDLPRAYRINGAVYLVQREALLADRSFHPEPTAAFIMPPERSVDIDTEMDLALADLLLTRRAAAEAPHSIPVSQV